MGVNIVVDMRGNRSEQSAVEKLGMRYVSIPWNANSPSDEVIARFWLCRPSGTVLISNP